MPFVGSPGGLTTSSTRGSTGGLSAPGDILLTSEERLD